MTYAQVNGLQLYYETHGSGRPLVMLHGGLMTIDLNFGPLLGPLAASRQVIAVELQGHGHRLPTLADFLQMRAAYDAVAPDPAHFDEIQTKTGTAVQAFRGWDDELRSLQAPTLLIFGDRDFMPLPDVAEMFGLLPDAELAVLPGTTHVGVTRCVDEVLALITRFLEAR
jgi:pimeloyl-ACP methyl ester carboxylesterase